MCCGAKEEHDCVLVDILLRRSLYSKADGVECRHVIRKDGGIVELKTKANREREHRRGNGWTVKKEFDFMNSTFFPYFSDRYILQRKHLAVQHGLY